MQKREREKTVNESAEIHFLHCTSRRKNNKKLQNTNKQVPKIAQIKALTETIDADRGNWMEHLILTQIKISLYISNYRYRY